MKDAPAASKVCQVNRPAIVDAEVPVARAVAASEAARAAEHDSNGARHGSEPIGEPGDGGRQVIHGDLTNADLSEPTHQPDPRGYRRDVERHRRELHGEIGPEAEAGRVGAPEQVVGDVIAAVQARASSPMTNARAAPNAAHRRRRQSRGVGSGGG